MILGPLYSAELPAEEYFRESVKYYEGGIISDRIHLLIGNKYSFENQFTAIC